MQATVSPTETVDPRSVAVQRAADEVCHVICDECWVPGMPSLCGDPDRGDAPHETDCGHPTCPMCETIWDRHECEVGEGS